MMVTCLYVQYYQCIWAMGFSRGSRNKVQVNTVVSRYNDTTGIRKRYHIIQTIEISSMNF